jgi:hypothetical protein
MQSNISNCSNDLEFFRSENNLDTESDYGSVEPWSLNNDGGILVQHLTIDIYKSPCYSEHTFQSKPLPAICPVKPFKIQHEEPLGFTELEPYKKQRRMQPLKLNPQSYPRKLESLSLTREFLAFVRQERQHSLK